MEVPDGGRMMLPFNLKQKLLLLLLVSAGASVLLVGITLSYMAQQLYRSESRDKLAEARHELSDRLLALSEATHRDAQIVAAQNEVVSVVNMVFTYQSKTDYQAWVFDPEKRTLAKELRKHVSSGFGSSDERRQSVYDGNGDLVSFAVADLPTTQAGYVAYERGTPVTYYAIPEVSDGWQSSTAPSNIPLARSGLSRETGFGLSSKTLAAISVAPILRNLPTGPASEVGHVVVTEIIGEQMARDFSRTLGTRLALVLAGRVIAGNLTTADIPAASGEGAAPLLQKGQSTWLETDDFFLQPYTLPLTGGGLIHVILGVEKGPIMAQITRTRVIMLGVLVVVAMVVTPFGLLLARRAISDPVNRLVGSVAAIKEGRYEVEVAGYTTDELGTLANAIHDMAWTIRERERELQTSQASLAEAQRLARLGNWNWDVTQGRLLCSDEIFRILSVPKSSLSGEYGFVLPFVHDKDRDRVRGLLDAAVNKGAGYDTDYRIVRPGGDVQVVHEKVEVRCDQGEHPTHILGTLQVVTELKKVERELRKAKAESDSSLRRSQEQLEKTRNQLIQSEKLAAIGQLAAGVAHEINNPIGYINSNFHTLQSYMALLEQLFAAYAEVRNRLPDGHPEKDRILAVEREIDLPFLRDDLPKLVLESREGGERVKKIVMDLKNFARQEETHWEQARLNEICEHTLNIVHNEIKYKADVVKEYGDIPPIRCLPVQLEQVLVNLLVNAAQAIDERGVITLRTGTMEGQVFVEVEDTGHGIAPEHLARLFEPFFTTKPPGSGTGLGLSISYTIVQRHGGEIRVESTPGKGSLFRVILPVGETE